MSNLGKAYVVKPISDDWALYVPVTETYHLEKTGIAVMPDLYRLRTGKALVEVDEDKLTTRPVAVFNGQVTQRMAIQAVKEANGSRLFRPEDIVDLEEMSRRTNRSKGIISGKWKKESDWPAPVMQLGNSEGWYWPEIEAFIRRHGWPLWRAEWDKPTRKQEVG